MDPDEDITDSEVAQRSFDRTIRALQSEGYSPCSILIGLSRCAAKLANRLDRLLHDDDDFDEEE